MSSKNLTKPIIFGLLASGALSCKGDSPGPLNNAGTNELLKANTPTQNKKNSAAVVSPKTRKPIPTLDGFKLKFNCSSSYWDTINNCYNAGGQPYAEHSSCTYYSCEGLGGGGSGSDDEKANYCHTYTINGQELESCTTCPQGQELKFSPYASYPMGCSPLEETSTHIRLYEESSDSEEGFGTKGVFDAPYAQVISQDSSNCTQPLN
jgi:hypothetical protein